MEDIGLQAAGLRREYFLSELPAADTVRVWVVDREVEYDGIDLATLGDRETVEGACDARALTNCVTFTYDPTRNSVTFAEFIPSAHAEVHVRYDLLSEVR
jgi:hypothetical protein